MEPGRSLPREHTSDRYDARLVVVEEDATAYPEPLDTDRFHHVDEVSTHNFPPPMGNQSLDQASGTGAI